MPNAITVTEYAEHTDDPKSWKAERPSFDVKRFNAELEKRTGCIGSVPRFRCVWGPDSPAYYLDSHDELKGYNYRENGVDKFVSCKDVDFEFPDNAVITPAFESIDIFIPRWGIEEYRDGQYVRLYTVEDVEFVGDGEGGRVDLLSRYREPSEFDIQRCQGYASILDKLTPADMEARKVAEARQKAKSKADKREALVTDIQEETVKALTDGLPNATKFGYNPNLRFDIRKHTDNVIKEHDSKL
jgi:hypothetical protein